MSTSEGNAPSRNSRPTHTWHVVTHHLLSCSLPCAHFSRPLQILLLAATNRPEVLDKALLRPGRISRRIVVPLPDEAARRDILSVHLRGVPMESDEYKGKCTAHLAVCTAGMSGAELYNVVNEGALLAARRTAELVNLTDLLAGVTRTRDGVNARASGLGALLARARDALMQRNAEPARASPLF